MDRSGSIAEFLRESGWLPQALAGGVSFLAAGEYNENHLVQCGDQAWVFRINHGSQLGQKRQIEYEFSVLHALRRSGVTPRPFHVAPQPPASYSFGNGVLFMEYLPGRPLAYGTDSELAAEVLARVHAQPVPKASPAGLPPLVVQASPVQDIADESLGLLQRYPEHPLRKERERLLRYHQEVEALGRKTSHLFADEPLVLTNTEVNSHNFIVQEGQAWLVDWEKAVVSQRWQDLGHFLVPTTTQWKRQFVYSAAQKRAFMQRYLHEAGLEMTLEDAMQRCEVMERTILLRALSWCFMAWYEYTSQERALKNQDTFNKILQYLSQMEILLD